MADIGIRHMYEAFMRGNSFSQIDNDWHLREGSSEPIVRAYIALQQQKQRTHWHNPNMLYRYCTRGRRTRDKDRITCRICIKHLKARGMWE